MSNTSKIESRDSYRLLEEFDKELIKMGIEKKNIIKINNSIIPLMIQYSTLFRYGSHRGKIIVSENVDFINKKLQK